MKLAFAYLRGLRLTFWCRASVSTISEMLTVDGPMSAGWSRGSHVDVSDGLAMTSVIGRDVNDVTRSTGWRASSLYNNSVESQSSKLHLVLL